jgi:LEA14-like dessication related protein
MKPQFILTLAALGLGLLVAGCNTRIRPDSVTVSVANLKAVDLTSTETRLLMTLRFTSESLNPFGFTGSTHKLYLNGGYVGRAVSNTPVGLPPMSTMTQDVVLVMENSALVRQLIGAQGTPVVNYRLESVLLLKSGDDDMRLKGDYSGTIDLRGIKTTP